MVGVVTKRAISFAAVAAALAALAGLLIYGMTSEGSSSIGSIAVPKRAAPNFSLTLFEVSGGGTFAKADIAGEPAVINFWASWCPPCKEEADDLEQGWQEYKDRGVMFLGVNVMDKESDALKFIDEYGVTYRNGPDKSDIALDFGMLAVPETFFINRDGMIVRKFAGAITIEQLRVFIDELLVE